MEDVYRFPGYPGKGLRAPQSEGIVSPTLVIFFRLVYFGFLHGSVPFYLVARVKGIGSSGCGNFFRNKEIFF